MIKILIYAPVDVFYYSFYIEGFYRLYGSKNVRFSTAEFPKFSSRILAAIVKEDKLEKKIVIDALDSTTIFKEPLAWCEVYGKVNYNSEKVSEKYQDKIIPIGPSFGIQIWSLMETLKFAIVNFLKSKNRIHLKRYYFTSYWRQYKRLSLSKYEKNSLPRRNFIYFISSLWKNESNTNKLRADFIEACQEIEEINFEGGFAPRSDKDDLDYKELIDKRIPPKKYIKKIKESILVFNTPAVQNCHGWKLPEFLMLGKAIISTEHINELSVSLEHGIHLHYVSASKEDMKKAILTILNEPGYRQNLEEKSKEYFYDNLAPAVVVKKMIDH